MMISLSEYIVSLSPPSSGGLTILLWSYLADTSNNNFCTSCFLKILSMETKIQSFAIGDNTSWGCCKIQLWKDYLTCWLIFVWPWIFEMIDHNKFPDMINLSFDVAAPIPHTEVFCLISKHQKVDILIFLHLNV